MKDSLVMFNEENHSYTIGERQLISVTELIKKYVLPDMYGGVDANLLRSRAEYGTEVHRRIEMLHLGFPYDDNNKFPEVVAYQKWMAEHQWATEKNEYLVSDNEVLAGTIDQVLFDGENYIIADLKTTSAVHMEYVRWQLSLYAYLFEKQNEGKHVGSLYVIHLHGDECKLVEVERIPQFAIDALVECEKFGEGEFINPLKQTCGEAEAIIAEYKKVMAEKADYDAVVKSLDSRKKELESALVDLCKEKGQDEFRTTLATVKKKADSIRKTFSLDKFAEASVSFFEKYRPKGTSKASVKKQTEFDDAWKQAIAGGYKETTINGGVTIKFV